MDSTRKFRLFFLAALAGFSLFAQGPGRGIPGVTEQQSAALAAMNADLASQLQALNAARSAMTLAPFAEPRDNAAIDAKAEAVKAAEVNLANARAVSFRKLQASTAKLAQNQVASLIAAGGGGRGGGGAGAGGSTGTGTIPGVKDAQVTALTELTNKVLPLSRSLNTARTAMAAVAFTESPDAGSVEKAAQAVKAAELVIAKTRADAFHQMQTSRNKLGPDQVSAFLRMGGSFAGVGFTQPTPMNFAGHEGFVSLFDGVSLKGWDGNPKFWRVENGAIVGESTPQNPSGNSYIAYRDMVARDFTFKCEIKVEGSGGSGIQYRSKTGKPWLANIADNVTANVGPVNLNWMMTGPQADFWPASKDWTGQFYSENTPMRILAWRGQVVEGSGLARKELMGNIGDREALGRLVKMNDWNEYTVIARGGTLIQIVNGQLMAVMVDDDPESSNNQAGLFGIEIEATTKVSVRNIRVKKLN
jgi:hypothetical protein